MIKCFIFDMDGVITSSSDQHFMAWNELAIKLGKKLNPNVEKYTRGVSRMDSLDIVLDSIGKKNFYTQEDKLIMAKEKNDIYVNMISKFTNENLFDGVLDVLEDLSKKNIKIALGSASKNGPLLLNKLKITKYFDYIVNPQKIEKGKPAPDIFLDAAQALDVDVSECVGVEDAIAGVEAIKSANMFAVGIGDKSILTNANIVFESMKEFNLNKIFESVSK